MEKELELAWLGGIIDGEGSIGVLRHRQVRNGQRYETWRPTITIINTNHLIIERTVKILTDAGIGFQIYVQRQQNPNWKDRTNIQLVGLRRVAKAIPLLRPYVYGKAAQLDLLDRLIQSRMVALTSPRRPRKGGGSEMPGFSELEESMVAGLQRLNAVGTRSRVKEIV